MSAKTIIGLTTAEVTRGASLSRKVERVASGHTQTGDSEHPAVIYEFTLKGGRVEYFAFDEETSNSLVKSE